MISNGDYVTVGREKLVWEVLRLTPTGAQATIRSGLSGRVVVFPTFRLTLFVYNPTRKNAHV